MLYCPDPTSLVSRTPNTAASKTLQELIQVERTHEASFRAWNQESLVANQAINSWALADSADDRIIEVVKQVSHLLTKSVKAQNQYAIALADYRGCLKEIMIRESTLRSIQRQREILLKRLLKLNKQSTLTHPAHSLHLNIKLDDAKRELSVCQKNLKAASDALFNAKQFALRDALTLKLARFEQLGHTIKLNAAQAIQLLAQLDHIDSSADDESDFESCDEDPTLDDTNNLNNPRTESTTVNEQQPTSTKQPIGPSPLATTQQPPTRHQPQQAVSPTIDPNKPKDDQSRGLPEPAAKRRSAVKRRASPRFKKRRSQMAHPVQSTQQPLAVRNPPVDHRSHSETRPQVSGVEPRPQHVRKRSQSLDTEVRMISQHHRTTSPVHHLRQNSLGRLYPASANGSSRVNISSSLNPSSAHHKTRESLHSFKLFSRGMFSKLASKGKRKEDHHQPQLAKHPSHWRHSSQSHPIPDLQAAAVGANPPRREVSLWPTIEPLSLYTDSDEEGEEEESGSGEDSMSTQGDDELETAELGDELGGLGRGQPGAAAAEAAGGGASAESGPSHTTRHSWGTPTTFPGTRRRSRPTTSSSQRQFQQQRGRAGSDAAEEESSGSEGLDRRHITDYLPPDERAGRRRRQREHRRAIDALTRTSLPSPVAAPAILHRMTPVDHHRPIIAGSLSDKENRPALPDYLIQYDSDFDFDDQVDNLVDHRNPHRHHHLQQQQLQHHHQQQQQQHRQEQQHQQQEQEQQQPVLVADDLHRQHLQLEQIQQRLLSQQQKQSSQQQQHQEGHE
ncbi:hypothetical protein PCASD_13106 [Puccinia coronata f. sp. avenae]|uniref:Uncharacterized protein n=1 Tax=Puccinia coronata f. sp. avenae TaxID=200324 RepID=A0A2N5UD72_9BASI|nr:hypothetical protein PCASD_13106 [Puccinia coronata f. sp. avenae]